MLKQVQEWYREAASLHGDDWPEVERYVAAKLEGICDTDRARLLAEFNAFRVCRTEAVN